VIALHQTLNTLKDKQMKKLVLFLAVAAMISFVACKPKTTNEADKAKADSIENVRIQDSIKAAEEAVKAADTTQKDTTAVKEVK